VLLLNKTIEHFINGLHAENKSIETIRIYGHNLNLFQKHAGTMKLAEVSALQIRDFLGIRAQTTKPATVHSAFRTLRTFFNWCLNEGLLETQPMQNIKPPKLDQKIIPTFTGDDIKRLLNACKHKTFTGERNKAIILCLVDSGIRITELINLSLNDVDYRQGIIKVMGKGKKERLVRIGNNARQQLWRYMLLREIKGQNIERLFLSEEMRPMTKSGLGTIIKKIGKDAEIDGKRCSPHTFRHSFAVAFLRAGGNVFDLKQLLGHSSIDMVERYSRSLSSDDALKAHQQFSPGDRLLK
jgi:site-specific recombinase XerD